MSRPAALLMFLAWLLCGAMPAIGMSPMPMRMESAPAVQDASQHHGHGKTVQKAKAEHVHDHPRQPCAHGGKSCATPFCAACLALLPEVAIRDGGPYHHPYPAASTEQALGFPDPAPLTPPPRA